MSRAGFLAAHARDAALIASEAEPVTYNGSAITAVITVPSDAENYEGVHSVESQALVRVVDVPEPKSGDLIQDESDRLWRVNRVQNHGRLWWRLSISKWRA